MANNKVQLADGTTIIDITDTTATTSDVAQGKYFYTADGVKRMGTASSAGGVGASFSVEDFVMPSAKFVIKSCIPNLLSSGGCIHYAFYRPSNTSTSADKSLLCFGAGAISSWSPSASAPAGFVQVEHNNGFTGLYMRGAGNSYFSFPYNDADFTDVKLYIDHWINMNTGISTAYSSSQQTFMTALSQVSYLSVGSNQSNPLSGAVISKFAVEEA